MKKIILMFTLSLVGMVAVAQSTRTIKGAVVDRNGNPLPGASIEATGGAEGTTVDADGTFTLEVPRWLKTVTAKYPGMSTKRKNVTDSDMIFTLDAKFQKGWMVSVVGGYGGGSGLDGGIFFGAMGAYLNNWGGYLKAMICPSDDFRDETMIPTVTIGATKRLTSFMHMYAGAGYSPVSSADYGFGYDDVFPWHHDGGAFELGFIFMPHRHVSVSAGYTLATDFEYFNSIGQVGIGYVF